MKLPLTQNPTCTFRDIESSDGTTFNAHEIVLANPDGVKVAVINVHEPNTHGLRFATLPEAEEAAQYITRAVNCHAELLAAVIELRAACLQNGFESEFANQAIAKAKGEA